MRVVVLLSVLAGVAAAQPVKHEVMPRVAEVTITGLPSFAEVSEWKGGSLTPLFLGNARVGEARLALSYEAKVELQNGAILKETPNPREIFLDVRAPGFSPRAFTLTVPGPTALEAKLVRISVVALDATGCAVKPTAADSRAAELPWLQVQAGQARRALPAYRAARDAVGPWLDYELALAALEAGDRSEALTRIGAFLEHCPGSPRRADAKRLLEGLLANP